MRLIYALMFCFLVGCSSVQDIEIKSTPVERPSFIVQEVEPVSMRPIKFKILTVDNTPYFGLSTEYYQNLVYDIGELQRYIESQNTIINGIKEYYNLNKNEYTQSLSKD